MAANRGIVFAAVKTLTVGLVCLACFLAGGILGTPDSSRTGKIPTILVPVLQNQEAIPAIDTRVEDPRLPEAMAEAARRSEIAHDAALIEAECSTAAGGDWDMWLRNTAPYRADLRRQIESLKEIGESERTELRQEPLVGRAGFPLVELAPLEYLPFLYDPGRYEHFRSKRPVVAVDRWLRRQGIELIFVPAPKMTEVYIENFVNPFPADGLIAPHVRRALLELLRADVEVVDGWRLFRSLRDTDSQYLYNSAESHWGPRGMRIMAKEVARRIERYRFGARARYGQPLFNTKIAKFNTVGIRLASLPPEQQARADAAQVETYCAVIGRDGLPPEDDPTSPVLLIGNSYAFKFREQLVRELNLRVRSDVISNMKTEAFADFLRNPEMLAHARVVVWITTEGKVTELEQMPAPIMQALDTTAPPVAPSPPRP
jgi:hypothetical protein